jgi:hypothetical protein
MRFGPSLVVACAVVGLAAPAGSLAAVPSNRADPCAHAGRDSCGTTGVGFYKTYRYGVRWFGDFRRVVPGETHTFCLDLRFWYGSRAYRYRSARVAQLRNKDGAPVSAAKQAQMAYALWEYGRSEQPRRQAAVMLYVHRLMGDGRVGEVNPAALGPGVVSFYGRIARTARRYHGPYRIEARLSAALTVGQPARATVRILSAEGNALPGVGLTISADGADTRSRHVRTDGSGSAAIALVPTAVGVRLRVATEPLPSSRPRIFVPTSGAAAENGQRLAAPSSQSSSTTVSGRAQPVVAAAVSSQVVRAGSPIFDRVRVEGLGGVPGQVDVELFGPFAGRRDISCSGRPYSTRRLAVAGNGERRSPLVDLVKAGFYTYRVHLLGTPTISGSTTECGLASGTSLATPTIVAGRGDVAGRVRVAGAGGRTPVSVRVPSVRINARVVPVGIDVAHGVLGLPSNIERAGWWRDGTAPGAAAGAILIAGHVDSARAGAGAFFRLHSARVGALVRVATAGGRAYVYRVASVRKYRKSALPTSVFTPGGPARLVLVTCGGRFDPASGHYEDNVVLVAVPV